MIHQRPLNVPIYFISEQIRILLLTHLLIRQFAKDYSFVRETLRQMQANNISTFDKTDHHILAAEFPNYHRNF
jgi:hypothetical protein